MPPTNESNLEKALKKSEKMPTSLPWRFMVFTILVFTATFAIYFGMAFGYKPYLNLRIKNLDKQITNLTKSIDEGQQKELATFYSQLSNIQGLLNSHPIISNFFSFLESRTHPQVYYSSLDLSSVERVARVEGFAADYGVLSQQLELFRSAPEVSKVSLETSQLSGANNVNFAIRINFKPDLFKLPQ
jgi:hypothetical protein